MIRATTPIQEFILDKYQEFKEILITYKQNGTIILEKEKDDVTIEDNKIYFRMTQAETKLFSSGVVEIQLRALTPEGIAIASNKISKKVEDVLDDKELV